MRDSNHKTHRHGQQPSLIMPKLKTLIRKTLRSIDTRRPCAIPIQKIPTLYHKLLNHTMEATTFVALRTAKVVFRLASAELAEVFGSFGDNVFEKLKGYAAERFTCRCTLCQVLPRGIFGDGHKSSLSASEPPTLHVWPAGSSQGLTS
jgi:hypothetical protein